jgi:hypothetical protein
VADEQGETSSPGRGLVNVTFLGTGLLVGTSLAAAAAPTTFGRIHAVVSCALFVVGTAGLLWAYALGVSRSRTEAVDIPGLFFLGGGTAPSDVRRPFRVALAVQVVAVVAAAAVRPYSEVAFGILAPMFGLGLMGSWGGRHGAFPARAVAGTGTATKAAADGDGEGAA